MSSRHQRRGVNRIQVDIVLSRIAPCPPTQIGVHIDIGRAVSRLGNAGLNGDIQEPDFTETAFPRAQIRAIDDHPDVLSRNPFEINGRIRVITGEAGGPIDHSVTENGPIRTVDGILDRDVFDAETKVQFKPTVVIPNQSLMKLVDLVESTLQIKWCIGRRCRQPHVHWLGRMCVVFVETRAVDRILRAVAGVGDAIGRSLNVGNRIGERLGREAPDIATINGVIRGGIDFVDPPVIGRIVFKRSH